MGVRRQCNRYKTNPYGSDFNDVLKRAKAFFKDGEFMIWGGTHGVWCADFLPGKAFSLPKDAHIFRKVGRRWIEVMPEREE